MKKTKALKKFEFYPDKDKMAKTVIESIYESNCTIYSNEELAKMLSDAVAKVYEITQR